MPKFRKGQSQKNQGDTFFSAHSNHERKNWRKRDNNPLPTYPQSMNMGNMGMNMGMGPGVGMGLGNYYYPGSLNPMAPMTPMAPVPPMAPMPFPGPAHPTTATAAAAANVHGNNAVMGPPKTVDPPRGYIDPYYLRQSRPPRPASTSPIPQEDVPRIANWADDVAKHYLLEETSVNESTLAARVDQLADEEKRLFLDEYRFPGMQTYEPPNCPRFTESDLEKRTSSGLGENAKRPTSKLRGDAPEFVPMKKREPTWMVVTSW